MNISVTNDEHKMCREMLDRLLHHEQEVRHSYKIRIKPPQPDINVLAFKIASNLDLKRTFGRILRALVKYRDKINTDVRRYLIKQLRQRAVGVVQERPYWGKPVHGFRNVSERNAAAERCAQLWNSIADQLDRPPIIGELTHSQRMEEISET